VSARRVAEADAGGGWRVERWRGTAGELHDLAWPDPVVPTVWLLEAERPALVLGSTQSSAEVDATRLAAAGIELAHRRSGGGAVLVEPGASTWIDVVLPRGDARWRDDVSRSFDWLARVWCGALSSLGVDTDVHDGALVCGAHGRRVCFASVGPGELSVDGAKLVGLSQRRTRDGGRYQCLCHRVWHPEPLAALGIDPAELPPVATIDRSVAEVQQAFVDALVGSS
jgi:lipoate---protein ligase